MKKLSIHLKTIVSRSVQLLSMMVFVPLLIASSCSESFDDSALWDSLNSLEERISAMETVMAAYKNKLLINSITETDNGYIITFSDGSQATITNGEDGKDGSDGDTYIQNIIIGDNEVTFILTDGQRFSIAMYNSLDIEFDSDDLLLMIGNQTKAIGYKITSNIQDVEIEVMTSADIKAKIINKDKSNPLIGEIQIITGAVIDTEYSKVVVIVTNGERIIMRKFLFTDEGLEVMDNAEKIAESYSGEMALEFISSVPYEVIIPSEAQSWISYNPTKAAELHSIVISLAKNEGYARSADITVRSTDGSLSAVFNIRQKSDREFIEDMERPALEEFYKSMGGGVLCNLYNWCTDAPIYTWDGITTDEVTGRVTGIKIDYIRGYLSGEIPPSISDLTELRTFSLDCAISDLPKEFAKLEKLEHLELGQTQDGKGNRVTGALPECIYSLKSLKKLIITHHKITSISKDISKLENLEVLNLHFNKLTGTIPPEIGSLSNLNELELSYNQINGSIPKELCKLTRLELLDLGLNSLSGTIPPEIGQLTNLKLLSLGDNGLSGEIPSTISNLTKLERLSLSFNKLTGNIPYLGNMTNLKEIILECNELTGNIPDEISNLRKLTRITLLQNKLTGHIPEGMGNPPNLEMLHLNYNQLTGGIPASLASANNLTDIWLDHNHLSGKVPEEFYNTSWWRNSWGSIVVGNNLEFSDAPFPGPDFTMDIDILGDRKYKIADEYAKNKYTILFQWSAYCPHLNPATTMLIDLHKKYGTSGLKIIGRSYMENATYQKIDELKMPWTTYFNQQLNYPTFVTPTITVIDQQGMMVFSDLIQDRDDLPEFIENAFSE